MANDHLNTPEEIWKAIPDFPGYEASTHGRIRSYWRRVGKGKGQGRGIKHILDSQPQRILKTGLSKGGYPIVSLSRHPIGIYRLILLTFVGPCPPGHEGMHLDGVKTNCFLINLRWGTRSENMVDKFKHGHTHQGMNIPGGSKLTDDQVLKIRSLYSHGHLQKDIAKTFNISKGHISEIINRKKWTHLP